MDISNSEGVTYCEICNYEAEDFCDLDAHTNMIHKSFEENDQTWKKIPQLNKNYNANMGPSW